MHAAAGCKDGRHTSLVLGAAVLVSELSWACSDAISVGGIGNLWQASIRRQQQKGSCDGARHCMFTNYFEVLLLLYCHSEVWEFSSCNSAITHRRCHHYGSAADSNANESRCSGQDLAHHHVLRL